MSDPQHGNEWYADGLRFTCTQCGNCCTGPSGYVWFDEWEGEAIAEHLGLSEKEFKRQYAMKSHGQWSLGEVKTRHGYDCVFLDRTEDGRALCSIYPVRPSQCRTWPFWPENLRSRKAYEATARNTPCPGMKKGLEGEGQHYPAERVRECRDET